MAAVGQKSDDSGHPGSQSQQMPVPVPLNDADLILFFVNQGAFGGGGGTFGGRKRY